MNYKVEENIAQTQVRKTAKKRPVAQLSSSLNPGNEGNHRQAAVGLDHDSLCAPSSDQAVTSSDPRSSAGK